MIARPLAVVAVLYLFGTSASALTMQECSAKYKAAQISGTLKGQKWQDFRKAECGAAAAATPAAVPVPTPAPKAAAPAKPVEAKPAAVPAAAGNAMFPNVVSPKY